MDYLNNIEKININKNIEKETYEKEKQNKYEIENINKKIEIMNNNCNKYDKKFGEISDQIKELYNYNTTITNKLKEIDIIINSNKNEQKKLRNEIKVKASGAIQQLISDINSYYDDAIIKYYSPDYASNLLNKIDNYSSLGDIK